MMTRTSPATILVADDHPIVIKGIQAAIEPKGIELVGQVAVADKIVESVAQHSPDVLITESRIAGRDALKPLESLKESSPNCQVIVFSAFPNPTNIARASVLGCHEYILKTSGCEVLMAAIDNALAGNETPENSLLRTTKTRMSRKSDPNQNSVLTQRETQVLRHVAMGLSNREVGNSLGISVETVKEHVQSILRKLNVNDRTQAAVWAMRMEMI